MFLFHLLFMFPFITAAPNLKYGVYDYFVDESSPIIYNGQLLMFESIVRASPQWAGNWLPAFANCACYFRVRDMHTLNVIVNLTKTCNHAFGAATVYKVASKDTLLISGTPWVRANSQKATAGTWSGPCQSNNCSGQ